MAENRNLEVKIEKGILGTSDGKFFKPANMMVTHPTPDIDALGPAVIASILDIHFGKLVFEAAESNGTIYGKSAQQLLEQGVIAVDIGGGELDHHPAGNFPGQRATSRFYELLPAELKNKKLDSFVKFVTDRDTRRTQQPFDLSHIVKIFARNNDDKTVCFYTQELFNAWMKLNGSQPNKALFLEIYEEFAKGKSVPATIQKYVENVRQDKTSNIPDLLRVTTEETRDLIKIILFDEMQSQLEFNEAVKILRTAPRIPLSNLQAEKDFEDRFLTYCATDNKQFVKAGLYEGFSVIIVKNSKGQVQIFSQANHHIPMSDIASAIVAEEIKVSGNEGEQRWYFHQAAKSLLNGSRTTPNQIPTTLSLEKIVEINTAVFKINNGWLPFCKGGKFPCSKECDYFLWQVSMCQETRKQQGGKNRGEIVVLHKEPGESKPRRRLGVKIKKLNPQRS